jgi:hypothetical protein
MVLHTLTLSVLQRHMPKGNPLQSLRMASIMTSTSSAIGSAASITLPEISNAVLSVEEYASSPPKEARTGFPKQGGQSLSYWLQQVRCDPLVDHRMTEILPAEADTVIIGSGSVEPSWQKIIPRPGRPKAWLFLKFANSALEQRDVMLATASSINGATLPSSRKHTEQSRL